MFRQIVMVVVLAAFFIGCDSRERFGQEITADFYQYRYEEALTKLGPKLVDPEDRDYALNMLRQSSCQWALARYDAAMNSLVDATAQMEQFEPDGEFKAVVIREEEKDFLGDPYEQMMAFFYLAMLDYQKGDYDKAYAGFKTALLADAGSREERYRADSTLVHFMMGKTLQRLHDDDEAETAFEDARNMVRFRMVFSIANKALEGADALMSPKDRADEFYAPALALMEQELSMAAMDTLEPGESLQAAVEYSLSRIPYYCDNPDEASDKKIWKKLAKESQYRGRLVELLNELERKAVEILPEMDTSVETQFAGQVIASMDAVASPDNNVLVMVELGRGPYKYRTGRHGHLAKIARYPNSEAFCQLTIGNDASLACLPMEDVYYQASTRGGREMDSLLAGKAVFKDTTMAIGAGALIASTQMRNSDAAAAAAIIGLTMMAVSAATNPAADIRCWEQLPDQVHLCGLHLEPGRYSASLDFYDQSHAVLPGFHQQWDEIDIEDGKETVLFFRSGANKPVGNQRVETAQCGAW